MEELAVAEELGMPHPNNSGIVLDDDNYDDEDDQQQLSMSMKHQRRMSKKKSNRRRRRSSARFLKMGEISEETMDNGGNNGHNNPRASDIGEVYKNAIRMNAENRINASNSWNLNLIDHLDRFMTVPSNSTQVSMDDSVQPGGVSVNFTKASCTLDASVKIYSYRVDDVHLTSYKVLANLHRTDTTGNNNKAGADGDSGAADASQSQGGKSIQEKRRTASSAEKTLESNEGNINVQKLEEAVDVDPLFHKMSKTFDEGGAKGLLLANLGVSDTGCNIVFDSTLDAGEEEETEKGNDVDAPDSVYQQTTIDSEMMDVSALTAKLESMLGGQTVQQLPLVPQLESLRSDFCQLQEEGFVEKVKPSKRYASSRQEEAEADKSIHFEAMERSRASQAELGRSLLAADSNSLTSEPDDYAPVDFGDDDDDIGDDGFMGSFIHDGDHRFSSSSFQNSFEASQPPSQASVLLDAIAAGDISGSQSSYEYFNSAALKSVQGNTWAGAAHWKKLPRRKPKVAVSNDLGSKTPAKSKRKGRTAKNKKTTDRQLNLLKPIENLDDLRRLPPKNKRGTDPLQLTKAAKTKYTKNENLLPVDLGLNVNTLTSLFMRPNCTIADIAQSNEQRRKTVGFGGVETSIFVDNPYGGDDDNDDDFGYDFGGDNDDMEQNFAPVPELEGVRKVEKVKVGFATVAKKVDVKRLKRDLWIELESTFASRENNSDDEVDENGETIEAMPAPETPQKDQDDPLSFQAVVDDMQATQSQVDVTLPFYFICVLHLANEKGLALESTGLQDFLIHSS